MTCLICKHQLHETIILGLHENEGSNFGEDLKAAYPLIKLNEPTLEYNKSIATYPIPCFIKIYKDIHSPVDSKRLTQISLVLEYKMLEVVKTDKSRFA